MDISEQAEYQQKIEQALREKNTLLAELHHRVKNNLALINSLSDLQLFNSTDPRLESNLSDVKQRIMTIASTHKVLYQNGNLIDISFKNLLQELISSGALRDAAQDKDITIKTDVAEFYLGIEQAGLLLNELLSLILASTGKKQTTKLDIRLSKHDSNIHLIIEGDRIFPGTPPLETQESLQQTLVETLVKQLDGNLQWSNINGPCQKVEFIFVKKNSSSPGCQLLQKDSD